MSVWLDVVEALGAVGSGFQAESDTGSGCYGQDRAF